MISKENSNFENSNEIEKCKAFSIKLGLYNLSEDEMTAIYSIFNNPNKVYSEYPFIKTSTLGAHALNSAQIQQNAVLLLILKEHEKNIEIQKNIYEQNNQIIELLTKISEK